VLLSVVLITKNEEANIGRTLASVVDIADEIILVDSGSADQTLEIARAFGPKVKLFVEEWKGFTRQKNSAIEKAGGDWILSLDADEEVSPALQKEISQALAAEAGTNGFSVPRKNFFLGQWIRYGGFYPDRKLRLVLKKIARFEDRAVHEDIKVNGPVGELRGALLHHAYPTLSSYLEHMNRYSSLAAEMAVTDHKHGFSVFNIVVRPCTTFVYNYFLRLGFLDGREGLLLHLYHAVYVSWKYAKIWEISRVKKSSA
jgi:glycosyltransferase involved in cell wall biosynthesis